MEKQPVLIAVIVIAIILGSISCRKEFSCEDCIQANKPPIAVAGPDQILNAGTDSAILDGSASEDQDGEIKGFEWRYLSGQIGVEVSAKNKAVTSVRKLSTGRYQFELKVTDDKGVSDFDTVDVIVGSPPLNRPPVANAGIDQVIYLPVSSVELNGDNSTDPDNNITRYEWRNLNSLFTATITKKNDSITGVINLGKGIYEFELKVEDAFGLSSLDTVIVDVRDKEYLGCDSVPREVMSATLKSLGSFTDDRTGLYTVVSSGSKIYIAGGLKRDGGISSRVDIYDTETNTWASAELSLPRFLLTSVSVGNKILFGGGAISKDGLADNTTDRVDILDLGTNTWSSAALSKNRASLIATSTDGIALFAGGATQSLGANGETLAVDIYEASTGIWRSTMLSDRSEMSSLGICATVWGSKIYLAGSVGNWFAWDFGGEYSNTINIYDVVQKRWTRANLSESKGLMGGLAVNGKAYFAGGTNVTFGLQNRIPLNTVEIHDLSTGAVSFSCLATNTIQPDIVHHGSDLIFFTSKSTQDGWIPEGVETDVFNIYDLNSGKWKVGKLPVNIHDASMVKVGSRIFIVGGVVNGQPSSRIWELDY